MNSYFLGGGGGGGTGDFTPIFEEGGGDNGVITGFGGITVSGACRGALPIVLGYGGGGTIFTGGFGGGIGTATFTGGFGGGSGASFT